MQRTLTHTRRCISTSFMQLVCLTATSVSRCQAAYTSPSAPWPSYSGLGLGFYIEIAAERTDAKGHSPTRRCISTSFMQLVCLTATGVSRYQAAYTSPSAPRPRNLPNCSSE